jgi:hypothetical protein
LQLTKPLWSTIFSYLHLASFKSSYRGVPASDLPALRLTCCALAALALEKSHTSQSELVLEAWASQVQVRALVNAAPFVRVVTICLHDRDAIEGRMGAETYMMGTIQLTTCVVDLLVSGRDVQRCAAIPFPSSQSNPSTSISHHHIALRVAYRLAAKIGRPCIDAFPRLEKLAVSGYTYWLLDTHRFTWDLLQFGPFPRGRVLHLHKST